MSSEYGYIPQAPTQSWGNNKGIFTPNDIYDLTRADKFTNYGELELIQTQTVSSVGNIDFTNLGDYDVHYMTMNNAQNAGANSYLGIVFSTDGGSSWVYSNDYERASMYGGNIAFGDSKTTGTGLIPVSSDTDAQKKNGHIYVYRARDSQQYTFVTTLHGEDNYPANFLTGYYKQTNVVNAFRLTSNDGGNYSGTFSLYGIRFS